MSLLHKVCFRENVFRAFNILQITRKNSVNTIVFKPRDFDIREKEIQNTKSGRRYALLKIEELLGVRKYTALDLVMKNKKLWEIPGSQMDKNFKICKNENITKATCIKYPEILAQPDLPSKISLLKKIPYDINEVAPLAMMCLKDLLKFIGTDEKISEVTIRLKQMKRLIEAPPDVFCEAFVKRQFLRKMCLKRFEENIKLLTKHGVSCEEIIKDWWVVQYNSHTIQQRIDLAKEGNIDKIKTWMVRGQVDIFENYVKRRSDNKQILGDNTLAEYLSVRLQCTIEQAKGLMIKMPPLKNKSMKKLEEIIDFLYTEGFKPYHICRVPKILVHSTETTKKRIRELDKQGMKLDSLHMLTKSQKQYMQYYEALVKSNKSKIKSQVP